MAHSRDLAFSPFPGDDGQPSPRVRKCLEAAAHGGVDSYLRAAAALGEARLLVPVVATVTRDGATDAGLRSDKEAEMSVVLWQTADGRRCAVAFTGLDSLTAWHPAARPVAVTIDQLAKAALDDGATALLLDPAGPAPLLLEDDLLKSFARGQRLVQLADGDYGWLSSAGPRDS